MPDPTPQPQTSSSPTASNPAPEPGGVTPTTPLSGGVTRRHFLLIGWSAFGAFMASSLGATVKYFLPNVLYEPSQKFKAGKAKDYPLGVTIDREHRVWIIRTDQGLYVMWARCTHLGCTPNWFPAENRFRCPCHGSNYTLAGDVIAGPAPKPLWRCSVAVSTNGELIVDKAVMEDRPGRREKPDFFIPASALA
jgi:cytochrome b6-f complex iron-sulfur subunit